MKLKLGESVGETNKASLFIIGANKNDPKSVLTVLRSMRKTTSTNLYTANVHSFTKGIDYDAIVSKKYLSEDDNILIIDDFLANGQAVLGLINIINQANANVAGVGIVIEKGFQDVRKLIEEKGYRVESLAIVDDFKDGKVILR